MSTIYLYTQQNIVQENGGQLLDDIDTYCKVLRVIQQEKTTTTVTTTSMTMTVITIECQIVDSKRSHATIRIVLFLSTGNDLSKEC